MSEWPAPPWPGSLSSLSCSCASQTRLPSSCQTPRSSGSCLATTRRKRAREAPATHLAIGPEEPSAGQTARRSSSCTTSWGVPSTPLPQTWSTWWEISHYPNNLFHTYSSWTKTFINLNLWLYLTSNLIWMCQQHWALKWGWRLGFEVSSRLEKWCCCCNKNNLFSLLETCSNDGEPLPACCAALLQEG